MFESNIIHSPESTSVIRLAPNWVGRASILSYLFFSFTFKINCFHGKFQYPYLSFLFWSKAICDRCSRNAHEFVNKTFPLLVVGGLKFKIEVSLFTKKHTIQIKQNNAQNHFNLMWASNLNSINLFCMWIHQTFPYQSFQCAAVILLVFFVSIFMQITPNSFHCCWRFYSI